MSVAAAIMPAKFMTHRAAHTRGRTQTGRSPNCIHGIIGR
jgi:hypothetical protein